jgi:hypothetical protein
VSQNPIVIRLRQGDRWWAAEFAIRLAGLGLLGFCAFMARAVYRLTTQPPQHYATLLEFVLGAVVVASLSTGLALFFEGPGLFRPVPMPPRPFF